MKKEGNLPKKRNLRTTKSLNRALESLVSKQTKGKSLKKKEIAPLNDSNSNAYLFIILQQIKPKPTLTNKKLAKRIILLSPE